MSQINNAQLPDIKCSCGKSNCPCPVHERQKFLQQILDEFARDNDSLLAKLAKGEQAGTK